MSHVHVELRARGVVRLPTSHVAVVICVSVPFLLFKIEKNILEVWSTVVEKPHDLYTTQNICRVKGVRLKRHVTCMREDRNVYKVLIRKSEGK
jgi:hypothetical protein